MWLQVALGPGVVVSIKCKAVSELLPNGMKEGVPLPACGGLCAQHARAGNVCCSSLSAVLVKPRAAACKQVHATSMHALRAQMRQVPEMWAACKLGGTVSAQVLTGQPAEGWACCPVFFEINGVPRVIEVGYRV